MTATEIQKHVAEKLKPLLDEFGFEGFVLTGYIKDSSGLTSRFFIADSKGDPMIQDALMPLIANGVRWASANIKQPE